ncbi:DNA mismatch repair endonuclease MutL [Lentilactobacillus kribbianus]|uniref:DNA mismatch repair endonuclease MutL n=1 Tax=Lentilactobacillus kribbianus TaxID=2729622 RepID=UPI001554598C|nr:DNA mismatch repair endonuclease MutL [Lentilactobacillus kribbianus]
MTKIHELPVLLADQIAAGEVVERPASVVKELVENAVDANSSEIIINILNAGSQLIQVIDNGDGIAEDQVKTAFLRHATSKISEQRDLFRVKTLGFRGEALPSINSVSDLTIQTATKTAMAGTELVFKGGQFQSQTVAPPRQGTNVMVKNLFYNTPARLKYLKSPSTELARITDIVNRIAVSYPEISFSLNSNGKELLRTSGRGNMEQVVAAVYGNKVMDKMLAVNTSEMDVEVSGLISLPEVTRSARKYISIILNGRYIRNYQLTRAIVDGYGSKLMVGRYPIAVIKINIDPALVDVNVHPTKQEVRISNEQAISKLITAAIQAKLAPQVRIPKVVPKSPVTNYGQIQPQASTKDEQLVLKLQSDVLAANKFDEPVIIQRADQLNSEKVKKFEDYVALFTNMNALRPTPPIPVPQTEPVVLQNKIELVPEETAGFPALHYIGQLHGTYLITETEAGMYMVDQHAAQERVNYEFYREQIGQVSADQQRLMVPIVLDYSTSDFLLISEKRGLLEQLGIYLEEFGQNSFVIREHPTWFKAGQEEDTIKEMIDWVLSDHQLSVAAFREKAAIMMSCKRAIKANHHLDRQQAEALLKKLPQCENPYNCPHGRPVLVEISNLEIEKMFKRIQDAHDTKQR